MVRSWSWLVSPLLLLAACASPPAEQEVRYGRIAQIETVTIDGDAQLGLGAIIGAVAGGVIGHQFGGGTGRDVATVAGVLGGGVAGSKVQSKTSDRRQGQHIIVKLDSGPSVAITQPSDPSFKVGDRVRIDGSGNDARVVHM